MTKREKFSGKKRKVILLIFNYLGVAFKNMPPCQKVLTNKLKRMLSMTRMIKTSNQNSIDVPKAVDGYGVDESNRFTIEYFSGYPYPQDISDLIDNSDFEQTESSAAEDHSESEFVYALESSDEEDEENIESYDSY